MSAMGCAEQGALPVAQVGPDPFARTSRVHFKSSIILIQTCPTPSFAAVQKAMPSPSPERALLYPTCAARLRHRSGRCARIVKTPGARCPVHSGGELSPEGRAIISTAAKARHARQRAAIRRNELRRYPQGRTKRWLIPRWWRLKLSDTEQDAVLAHMAEYDRRVRGGQPRPPWEATSSTSMVAQDLESCERALILAMNRLDPPPLETIEQVYANVREAEAIVGDAGSEVRLARLAWEIERFRRRRLEPGSVRVEESKPPGEVRASNPSISEQPLTVQPAARSPMPPDSFRAAVDPREAAERELVAELGELESVIRALPLAESSRAALDAELRYARAPAERLQVIRRWFAALGRAYMTSEAIVGHLRDRAELRSTAPRQDERRHSIWRRTWQPDE